MSWHYLYFFPEDPLHRPAANLVESTLAETRRLFSSSSQEITVKEADLPWFISCGADFEAVRCPVCSCDLGDWWGQAMDRWWEGDRTDLAVTVPCCGTATSLNALAYAGPMGFACFCITVVNPRRLETPADRGWLSEAVGHPLRIVHSRL